MAGKTGDREREGAGGVAMLTGGLVWGATHVRRKYGVERGGQGAVDEVGANVARQAGAA